MKNCLAILLLLCGFAAATPAAAHPPYGLVVDKGGNIYFSDLETVWRVSNDGRLSVFRPHVPETHVHALALAPNGGIEGDQNRYDPTTQRFYSGLWHRSGDGAERLILAMRERPPRGMGLWQDKAGNRYTSQWISSQDRRMLLLRRQPDGRVEMLFDEAGGAQEWRQSTVESIGGMAFGGDGSLFFANGGVLRRLGPTGKVTKLYDGGKASSLRGLAIGRDGRVLAADMGAKAVLSVGADGTVSTLYRETAAWLPTAIALARDRLLVLEANADPYERKDRVRLLEVKEGRGKVVASPAFQPVEEAGAPARESGGRSFSSWMILLVGLAAFAVVLAAWRLRPSPNP